MRMRFVERVGISSVIVVAFIAVALYSLWGASLLQAQRQSAVAQTSTAKLFTNQ